MPARSTGRDGEALVLALHCSGGSGRQWSKLAERLEPRTCFHAPDLIGAPAGPSWSGAGPFRLADEAEPVLASIDAHRGPVHLVGHSYGGGLALHVAAMRPDRIAGLVLYEPSAFHLLKLFGQRGRMAMHEIEIVANAIVRGLATGDFRAAAEAFVDYWNGTGSWNGLRPDLQDALLRYVPKAALDFHALIEEPTPLSAYVDFEFPVFVMKGEHAPSPTRLIAEKLEERVGSARLATVGSAGHMGPITHGDIVADLVVKAMRRPARYPVSKDLARLRNAFGPSADLAIDGLSGRAA